ncbi:tRNA (guanine(10)-N(2))-dimethyltransferase [Candidatus Bathyarchaeota archaeon]|nr:tRNA (guanine(10)-N(2))-dimethyltransferase [Candidatus Bathyarchaeota archaeon]
MSDPEFAADFPSETVREGKVKVLVPKLKAFKKQPSDYAPSKAPVFYNPVMELNRDISVLAFQAYQRLVNREISICDPLTGSGIRGVRFAAEIHGVNKVVVSDINERSFKLAQHNVDLNGLQDLVTVNHKDANCLLSCHGAPRRRFDIVDVDPFGSPVPYLDSAVRALRNKGLLAVTATDLAPLCGVHAKACVRKYGGKPLRTEYCHELAVRLLAGCVATVAAKQDIGVRVVFSHSSDHYIRVYAQIGYGAKKADASIKSLGYVLHCFNCLHREPAKTLSSKFFEKCPECGSKLDWAGPLWLGKIFDTQFCELMAQENRRIAFRNSGKISKLVALAMDEAEAPATYYVIDKIGNKLSSPVPSVAAMLQSLHDNGFEAVPTHFNSRGVRTNAPAFAVQNRLKVAVSS